MSIGWNFPPNSYGQRKGLNDSGEEFFKNNPFSGLAREICQNSMDAGLHGKCVRIEFELFEIERNSFPDIDNFYEAIKCCQKTWEKHRNTEKFFSDAIKLLNNPTIKFLRISDYNTTGLLGSDKINDSSNWINLIKSTGVSDKADTAGGSKGIGKAAAFECSSIKTVFYATKDINDLEAMQGVANLVSFKNQNKDEETQGIGYYGIIDKNQPIHEFVSLKKGYLRKESGTDIFIACFKETEAWKTEVICSILKSYLYAFITGSLEVIIDNMQINSNTLSIVFENYAEEIDKYDKNLRSYYEILSSNKTTIFNDNFSDMGEVSLYLQELGERSPRKVLMVRKPWMTIKEESFTSLDVNFGGVLIIKGDELNAFLRKLENPEHTNWFPKRAGNTDKITVANNVLKKLKNYIKNHVEELFLKNQTEELEVPGMGNLIPLEEVTNDAQNGKSNLSPDIIDIDIKIVKPQKAKKSKIAKDKLELMEDESGNIINLINDLNNNNDYSTIFLQQQTVIDDGKNQIKFKKVNINMDSRRLICINKKIGQYRLIFKSTQPFIKGYIILFACDEVNNFYPLEIKMALWEGNELTIDNNTLKYISCNQIEKEVVIDFLVNQNDYFSMEVVLYGLDQ